MFDKMSHPLPPAAESGSLLAKRSQFRTAEIDLLAQKIWDYHHLNHQIEKSDAILVYDHLFADVLQDGRFTTRFSVGPCFNLGKNIAKRVH
jgi:hypothetical protein